jgi:hypothetical protein
VSYTTEQRRMISLANALSRGYGPRVRKSLLEAMAVESSFRNLNYGDRDSQGVLQQRPSTGWGPPGNAGVDIRQYLEKAGALARRGFRGTAGQLAQAVQGSAFPGRYDEHRGEASALLGNAGAGGSGLPSQIQNGSGASGGQAWAQALLNPRVANDPMRLLSAIRATQAAPVAAQAGPKAAEPPVSPSAAHGSLAELFYDPLGAFKNGQPIKAIGGHSDHVHIATTNAQAMLAAIRQAQRLGLHVGENPYVGGVAPVHVESSYHYRDFPSRYGGRKLGEALDVSGSAQQMAAFFRWARRTLR